MPKNANRLVLRSIAIAAFMFVIVASLHEFRRYSERQRLREFYSVADKLISDHATADEVLNAIGKPNSQSREGTYTSWFYDRGVYQGRQQPVVVLRVDHARQRVLSGSYVRSN
jgi:hypothetical protein